MYSQTSAAVQNLLNELIGLSPPDPRRQQLSSDLNYWIRVRDYHRDAIPAAKRAVSNAQTALNPINEAVSNLEFEIRIRKPRLEEYQRARADLYKAMKPKLEKIAEEEARIRRIVDDIIFEHEQNHHGENETPHSH